MANEDFYITFTGTADRFTAFARFFDRLASTKVAIEEEGPAKKIGVLKTAIRNPAWIDLLDDSAIEKLSGEDGWGLEDILECVLNGEYRLVRVDFDGQSGRLVYDPWAYPFGGTDPLKALVQAFSLEVKRDAFWDGFAEWQSQNA